jgi:N-acyl-D-amino-acid deacylase
MDALSIDMQYDLPTLEIERSMTSPRNEPSALRPTRRQFLTAAAAGLTLWHCGKRAEGQVSGIAPPKLEAYDELLADFMRAHKPPGAALAMTYHGRLVYARGFGHADLEKQESVRPASLFRIASVSKPFTSAAVMHLIEKGRLKLDERVFPILRLEPHLEQDAHLDPRWHEITVRHCLQHTAGWDRGKSFDPMSAETAE